METTRSRFRAQVRDEVKEVALAQLAEGGAAAVSVNAIAKQLGVSGPALYRYFANRDELLTELVVDAYGDFAGALRRAGGDARALARAYRKWAVAQPHRYRLLFAPPLPGYDAHAPRLVEAAQEAMNVLLAAGGGPRVATPEREQAEQLAAWAQARGIAADPGASLRAIIAWARVHGLVSLELAGDYEAMGLDPEALFEAELAGWAD
jgi:AcrR family transcriptional regulator